MASLTGHRRAPGRHPSIHASRAIYERSPRSHTAPAPFLEEELPPNFPLIYVTVRLFQNPTQNSPPPLLGHEARRYCGDLQYMVPVRDRAMPLLRSAPFSAMKIPASNPGSVLDPAALPSGTLEWVLDASAVKPERSSAIRLAGLRTPPNGLSEFWKYSPSQAARVVLPPHSTLSVDTASGGLPSTWIYRSSD